MLPHAREGRHSPTEPPLHLEGEESNAHECMSPTSLDGDEILASFDVHTPREKLLHVASSGNCCDESRELSGVGRSSLQDNAQQGLSGVQTLESSSPGGGGSTSWFARVSRMLSLVMPAGGMMSAGFNLASTSIGAGIMGLPAAFNSTGIIMAAVYIVLVTAETAYSMRLLAIVTEKTGLFSFEEMMNGSFGRAGIYVVAALRFLHSFGACVAFVVTLGNLLTPILAAAPDTPEYLLTTSGTRVLQTVLWAVFFLPLSLPRRISSLRYVSLAGLGFILFFCACVIVHSCMNGLQMHPRPQTRIFNTGNNALTGMGVFIFSYMCQVSVGPILRESNMTLTQFTISCVVSMAICGTLYFLVGLFGYLDFGDAVQGSVLLHYNPLTEYQFLVSYIGIFIKICASYGLLAYSCRDSVYQALRWNSEAVVFWKHLVVTVALAGASLLCGLFIPNINTVFGIIGSAAGGFIGFILPALLYMYSGNWTLKSVGVINYVCTYLTLIAGCVAVFMGGGSAIWGAI